MRFALSSDHKDFFHKHQFIEFDEIFTLEQLHSLTGAIESVLSKRLQIPVPQLKAKREMDLFREGYDLWRDSEPFRRMTQKRTLVSLAAELFQKTHLRIAFDQYIATGDSQNSPFEKSFSLQELSSLSPLAGALLIQLKDLQEPIADFPLPTRAGNILFFSPELQIPWPKIFATPGLSFQLIVFGEEKTLFQHGKIDPYALRLKKLGYAFGDLLQSSVHPVIFRETSA